jgi:hypothetical protein
LHWYACAAVAMQAITRNVAPTHPIRIIPSKQALKFRDEVSGFWRWLNERQGLSGDRTVSRSPLLRPHHEPLCQSFQHRRAFMALIAARRR